MEFRDLKAQYRALQPAMDRAILETVASGGYIGGARVKALEERLAAYVGVKHCITCGNGTDALQLMLTAWGIGSGDAVFVPDFTFFASGEAVSFVGGTPVFFDVDQETFNGSAESLEQAIKAVLEEGKLTPKAVIAVDLYGLPADYPAIEAVARRYGLKVLEDAAQGFGGKIGNRRACSFGDGACTSFFPAKPLGCYGDGGAVFTNDDETAALVRSLCVHGKGSDKYDNVRIGMNSRLDAVQAAVLDVKLDAFESRELEAVNQAAKWYDRALSGLRTPVVPEGFFSSWAQYTLRLDSREQRDSVQAALKERGIPTMVYYPKPMQEQTAFGEVRAYVDRPNTRKLCETVLSLPMHPYLEEETVRQVAEALKECLETK